MSNSLYQILNTSRQDMRNRLTNLDSVSNNLANANTNGYKTERTEFQEMLENEQMSGSKISDTQILSKQGTIKTTDSDTDLMILGDGYFAVSLPDKVTGYTRDGSFIVDDEGNIVNSSGYQLVWDGKIPKGASEVTIDSSGAVRAKVDETWSDAGKIQISRFTNPSALAIYGSNVYLESANSGKAQTGTPGTTNFGKIKSQALEASNVNLGTEMVNMITIERGFQVSVKMFQQTDTMMSEAIHMRSA
jgi:flagellar basal-body rod protein FlgG